MTPQEKAKELVNKFKDNLFVKRNVRIYTEDAVECALITVDDILQLGCIEVPYWQEVKQEIENI